MRGSLLVTFDELINDRGVDFFTIRVNGVIRDLQFTDVNTYYSTFIFTGDTASIRIDSNDPTIIADVSVTRLDYTTDAEGIDNGIKETQIYPFYNTSSLEYTFTAQTVNSAYNFHYKFNTASIPKVVYSYSLGYDPSSPFSACQDYFTSPTTYYTWKPTLENGVYIFTNGQFVVQPAVGYYSDGTNVWYKGTGLPLTMESECVTPTPTPTPTATPGPTPTPTITPTPTPTLTPACACFDIGTGFDVGPGALNITIQSNGNFLIGGQFLNYDGFNQPRLINLDGCGVAITSFVPIFNNVVIRTRIQTDNKIIALGGFNNALGKNLTRLNTDGTKDATFNAGTAFDVGNAANNFIILSNGKLVAFGNPRSYQGVPIGNIVKINSDGSFNSSYGTGANEQVLSVVELSDNSLLVAGRFTSFNGSSYNKLVKITPGDTVDTTFSIGTGFDSDVRQIVVQPDNKIICVGSFDLYNGTTANGIIRLNSDGTIDNAFLTNIGTGSSFGINSVLLQSDGKILLNGGFNSFNGTTAKSFIRLNSDGTIDGTFTIPTIGDAGFVDMAEDTTGNLYFVGLFTNYNGTLANGIIRLNSSGNETICP